MKEQAATLVYARLDYQKYKDEYSLLKEQFDNSVALLMQDMTLAKEDVERAESYLRAAGLAHYAAHPDTKKLPHGLGVRVTQSLVYDADTAFQWAQEHKMALSLDKKAFEKIAKASPLDFVTVEEVPTITIPTDTAKLLEE
jgi:hypothetical protein